ncbi:MAG: insulinase family protein [Chlorobium sp.]|uniref:M16 family metallopeptidase n=1 Tax=Chlorobium sp. TaxID=1095 RepID=UPI0025C0749D|nr:pitrilysin family protein [Chlorobium sp.]MCF8384098.1 insulinase family protein [Chlorobium sp.]
MAETNKAQKPEFPPEGILSSTLGNGLRVVTDYVPWVQSVTLGIHIDAGSRDDPNRKGGIAHFLEHAVFKGTKNRDYIEIAGGIERNGGYLDAWTTKEQTCIYLRCLDRFTEPSLDLLADLVCNPVFPPEEIEKEKEVVQEEISSVNDTPEELVFEDFDRYLFDRHPLRRPILGTEESVAGLTESDLKAFMADFYRPEKMFLTATGNIRHETFIKLAERGFATLSSGSSPVPARAAFPQKNYKPFTRTLKKRVHQAQIVLGTVIPRHDPSFYPLMLLNTILGNGMSSMLNIELREKLALAYSTYSSIAFFDDLTVMNIYAGTDGNKIEQTLDVISSVLKSPELAAPPDRELLSAKSKVLGSLLMGTEKMTRRMSHLATDLSYFGRHVPLEEKTAAIEAVTVEAVTEAARKVLEETSLSTLVYKPIR